MRYGFTTGSCAAAAAKGAAWMLLTGRRKEEISIETPKGIRFQARLLDIRREEGRVRCAVRKDGGDDPDVTTGTLIYAEVSILGEALAEAGQLLIDGGEGVGRVTRPGLDQPVGNAAINHVPMEMIEREVREVCALTDYRGGLKVLISVPEGEKLAERTFNPRLGIVGGISILGTSGIVEPMSRQALLDTIRVELKQKRALGDTRVAVAPGNYGQEFMKRAYGYDLDRSVKCSNFIGDTVDMAAELGFRKILLTGHIGKLIKVAGGIMNTHSREADCRMELLCALAVRAGAKTACLKRILDCATTEEAVPILKEYGVLSAVMDEAAERICFYLEKRAQGKLKADCILYSSELGELAKSEEAEQWFTLLEQERERRI